MGQEKEENVVQPEPLQGLLKEWETISNWKLKDHRDTSVLVLAAGSVPLGCHVGFGHPKDCPFPACVLCNTGKHQGIPAPAMPLAKGFHRRLTHVYSPVVWSLAWQHCSTRRA